MAEATIAVPVSTMRSIAEQLKATAAFSKQASEKDKAVQSKVTDVVDLLIKAGAYGQADRETLTKGLLDPVQALDVLAKTASKIQPRRLGSVPVGEPATKKQASAAGQDMDEKWLRDLTA